MADAEIQGRKGTEAVSGEERETLEAIPQYYRELFRGFFEKFAKWRDVLQAGQEVGDNKWLSVVSSPDGSYFAHPFQRPLTISLLTDPLQRMQPYDLKDVILVMVGRGGDMGGLDERLNPLGLGHFYLKVTPGDAGKQLLVDLDGKPVQEAEIKIDRGIVPDVHNNFSPFQALSIRSVLPPPSPDHRSIPREVEYSVRDGKFGILRGFGVHDPMSDEYATHLLNTIDALIPGAQPVTPQPGRRVAPKLQTPRQLPAPGRRRPAGR